MSKTDKTDPGKLKRARGEKPKSNDYPDLCAWWSGRDAMWQETVKAQSGRDRAKLRRDARAVVNGADPEDVDFVSPVTIGTDWVVY